MNVVLDTNVIVSGLLNPYGSCGEIVRMIAIDELNLYFDARILSEYKDVLKRKNLILMKNKLMLLLKL